MHLSSADVTSGCIMLVPILVTSTFTPSDMPVRRRPWCFGSWSTSETPVAPSLQSNSIFKTLVMSSSIGLPYFVPRVSTKTHRGLTTPIAHESCNNHRLLNPFFTKDVAICRQMYAADMSTVGVVLTGECAATHASISLKIISSSVFLITFPINLFISAVLGAVSSGPASVPPIPPLQSICPCLSKNLTEHTRSRSA